MSRIVGIDLGTTNSLVAYVDDKTGLPRVIPDRDGQVLLPSIVSFTRDGVLVGTAAKRQLVRRPQSTVYSVKRLMGRGAADILRLEQVRNRLPAGGRRIRTLGPPNRNPIVETASFDVSGNSPSERDRGFESRSLRRGVSQIESLGNKIAAA